MTEALRFEGVELVEDNFFKIFGLFRKSADKSARRVAERIHARAVYLAPKKTGRMVAESGVFALQSSLEFGGYGISFWAPYALAVHYDPNATHTNGTDRFLEKAVQDHAHELISDISKGWRRL